MTERPNPRNIALVARRELEVRLRSRAFLLATLVLLVLAALIGGMPLGVRLLERSAITRIAIVVPDGALGEIARGSLDIVLNGPDQLNPAGRRSFDVSIASSEPEALAGIRSGTLAGALIVTRDPAGTLSFVYLTKTPANRTAVLARLGAVAVAVSELAGRAQGLIGEFHVEQVDPTGAAPPTEAQLAGATILATVLVVLLFFITIGYGMWVAASVVEEKSSRVIEVVLGAATPTELLVGKVGGIGLAGGVQVGAIVIPMLLALLLQDQIGALLLGRGADVSGLLGGLTFQVLAAFVVLGALGFLLAAFLYASAGSLVSRQEDVQQVSLPMLVLTMAGYIAAVVATTSIDAPWVAPLSLVPFFSPYLLIVRLMLDTVEPWELGVATVLLLVGILLAARLAARVYSAGVLLYGQRPSARGLVAAVRSRH